MHQATKASINSIIRDKLKKNLNIIFIDLKDESHLHSGHNEHAKHGNTHFSLVIVAKNFDNINLLARHKVINKILKEELEIIHALKIKAYNGKEYFSKNNRQKECLQKKRYLKNMILEESSKKI